MYAKVFSQIFDSSIAEKYLTRLVFTDLLTLADINGVVDMTHEAIARRTNVPLETVRAAIEQLEQPDPRSRTPVSEGRRLARLDEHRDWGWFVVNYSTFRKIASEEQRREKSLARVHKYRGKTPVTQCNAPVTPVNACNAMQREMEMKKQKEEEKPQKAGGGEVQPKTPTMLALGKIFHRRETTKWSKEELKALKEIGEIDPEDLKAVVTRYTSRQPEGTDYRRRDLATMLNNWNGEVDRARNFKVPALNTGY